MLLQVPREPRTGETQPSDPNGGAFEAGVRRDLAAASIVSYEPVLGGWRKRAFDLIVLLVTAPLWLPVFLLAMLWSKTISDAPMFSAERRIGYGGRSFKYSRIRLTKPGQANSDDEGELADKAVSPLVTWMLALERLPQIFSVLWGDMSLVGPRALQQSGLDQLKSARRYYLSARPGIFGIRRLVAREHAESQYKAYALSWSMSMDVRIICESLRGFSNRGRLWKPGLSFNRVVPGLALEQERQIVVRKRIAP